MDAAAPAPPASPPLAVHLVTGGGSSPEHALLLRSLAAARVVALDAEWKPRRRGPAVADDPSAAAAATPPPLQFPTVTLLQVACRGDGDGGGAAAAEPLRELFERPEVLKLGFRFKQDLVYLSATFAAALGSSAGFERVEPFLDVTNAYYYLKGHDMQKRLPRETKSLATICEELLGVYLSKSLAIYARAIESAYQSFHGIQSHTPIALTLKVPGEIETG
ncbi:hypothetical protein OsJ_24105 [Oryza sativa Japonica Group]|uniref:3'-5' exonuclease domain-containing protein n=1 Tax=Oryza sativa subsp. japonica TaxID=39947 RepID=A3BJD3_ORYSJ|nr:hypothetical protein OsJ_24105 [Oryza sativa Japonica Group]